MILTLLSGRCYNPAMRCMEMTKRDHVAGSLLGLLLIAVVLACLWWLAAKLSFVGGLILLFSLGAFWTIWCIAGLLVLIGLR